MKGGVGALPPTRGSTTAPRSYQHGYGYITRRLMKLNAFKAISKAKTDVIIFMLENWIDGREGA